MSNDLTAVMQTILSKGIVQVLRPNCMMPQLINRNYSKDAGEKGDTIRVEIPTAVSTAAVSPGPTPPANTDTTPGYVDVVMDNWQRTTPIHVSDKEMQEAMINPAFLPGQIGEGIKALMKDVNDDIFSQYSNASQGIFGVVGTAGTTPFGSGVTIASATNARKVLNSQNCPVDLRRAVLDDDAEAAALILSEFSDANKVGSADVKINGTLGRKFGIDWYSDQNVPTHTAGTIVDGAGAKTCAVNLSAGYAIGKDTIAVDEGAATSAVGTIVLGDIISFANHDQTYCVVANTDCAEFTSPAYTFATNDISALKFYPPLKAAIVDDEVITVKDSHALNLAFHRDAFGFATRSLKTEALDSKITNGRIVSLADPLTGMVLRMEVSRQHYQTAWMIDILWGSKLIRPELACRILG